MAVAWGLCCTWQGLSCHCKDICVLATLVLSRGYQTEIFLGPFCFPERVLYVIYTAFGAGTNIDGTRYFSIPEQEFQPQYVGSTEEHTMDRLWVDGIPLLRFWVAIQW